MQIKKFFNVSIRADALAKIWNWVHICPKEISGLGTVEVIGNNYIVDEVFLYKQKVSAADTELDSASVAEFMSNISEKKRRRLRFWWHSHVNMSTFWSSTDEACIKTLLQDDYIISTVFNKKNEHLTRVDIKKGWPLTLDGLQYSVEDAGVIAKMELDGFVNNLFPIQDIAEYNKRKDIIDSISDKNPVSLYRKIYEDFCKEEYKKKVSSRSIHNYSSYAEYANVKRFQRTTPPPTRSHLSLIPRELGL